MNLKSLALVVLIGALALTITPRLSLQKAHAEKNTARILRQLYERSKTLPDSDTPDKKSARVQTTHTTSTQIIVFSRELTTAEINQLAKDFTLEIVSCKASAHRCIVKPLSSATLSALAQDSRVSLLSNNDTYKLSTQTVDWGVTTLNAKAAWEYPAPFTGANVVVALVDTGVQLDHPDLAANIQAGGYDYINDDSDPTDDAGHGTAMAGFIAGVDNTEGNVGVAHGAKVLPFKACDADGYCYTTAIVDAINAAIIANVDIISMSFGGEANSLIQGAIDDAVAAGIVVVAAAGNENASACLYPAAYSNVVCVGAIDSSDLRGSFSNYGTGLDVVTPGVNNSTTAMGSTYATVSGTSGATAYYSGSAAVAISLVKDYCTTTPSDPICSDVRQFVQQTLNVLTVRDLGTAGYDSQFGYGAIDLSPFFSETAVPFTLTPTVVRKGKTYTQTLTFTNNYSGSVVLDSCTIMSDNLTRTQTVPVFTVTTLNQDVTPYTSPTNNVLYTTFEFGTPITVTTGQIINFSYDLISANSAYPLDTVMYSFECQYDLSSTVEVEKYRSVFNAGTLTIDFPDSLKNLYFTFAILKYRQVVYPSQVRAWDTMYIKNMDTSRVRFDYMFLYDFKKKGNQGYERYKKTPTSYGVRTSYLLPRYGKYAYVAVFTDIPTATQRKLYFFFDTK